jgi:diguanylate cyclase (GGDEF)-like protein/PAS domain S-box-containing protein
LFEVEQKKPNMKALLPASEVEHLRRLGKYTVLDTSVEQGYDDIVFLASFICNTPIALIGLIDEDRQWFKARAGLETAQAPLDPLFCNQTIMQPNELLVVHDACGDERFANSLWVTSEPHVRFYAGMPLVTKEGRALGILCVVDRVPRDLTEVQEEALRALSRQAIAQVGISHQVAALQESEIRFKAFMDNSPVVASLKDEHGRYIYVNQPFLQQANLQLHDIIGKDDFELWPENIARRLQERDRRVLAEEKSVTDIEIVSLPDRKTSYWQVSEFLLQAQRRLLGSMGLDITKAKLYEQQLMKYQENLQKTLATMEVLSVTDSLTGLYNRRAFEEKLEGEFERARRYNLPLSLLMLDADNFKNVNDTLGHCAGDDLLRSIARMLKENARANDVTARYGGDEFAVILPNTDSKVAFHLAERLRWAAKELYHYPHQVTISVGVSALSPDMADQSGLVIAADNALYDAKRKGRNQVSNIRSDK